MMSLRQTSLSHILLIFLTLALAGCGDSGSGGAAAAAGQDTSNHSTPQNASNTDSAASGPAAEQSFIRPVGDVDNGNNRNNNDRDNQPEVIENPILAAPLPVPVPEGEGPGNGKNAASDDKKIADQEKKAAREERKRKEKEEKRKQERERKKQEQERKKKEEKEKNADGKEESGQNEPDPIAERPSLRWDSPMTREDGSKLYPGEISGYKVYYKLLHQKKYKAIDVEGAHIDQLALDNFSPGAYEFSVSTVDTNGIESQRSHPVQVDLI